MPPHPIRRRRRLIEKLRFWEKVVPNGDCWEWTGQVRNGYGVVDLGPRTIAAHRYAYMQLVGPIPAGKELDHVCRNTICVNPDHTEPVTHLVNVRRGVCAIVNSLRAKRQTHCLRGHEFSPANTYITPDGYRRCRTCHASRMRVRYHAERAAA